MQLERRVTMLRLIQTDVQQLQDLRTKKNIEFLSLENCLLVRKFPEIFEMNHRKIWRIFMDTLFSPLYIQP